MPYGDSSAWRLFVVTAAMLIFPTVSAAIGGVAGAVGFALAAATRRFIPPAPAEPEDQAPRD
jgi:hypothetical protein